MNPLKIPTAKGNIYFNIQPFSLTISEDHKFVYHFDAEGRFSGGFFAGINYKRGLENQIYTKAQDEKSSAIRRFLTLVEKQEFFTDLFKRVSWLRDTLQNSEYSELLSRLDAILAWDFGKLESQKELFQTIYQPISILPPDHYLSVVLQITEGCTWNQCTFCTFYRGRAFRLKSPAELREHTQKIKNLFGKALGNRKSLFLADANALVIPQKRLLELLAIIHEAFPIGRSKTKEEHTFDGIYSFLDIFGAEKKSLADYQELQKQHVKRIYIGLESGDAEVFAFLNKPGSPEECLEAVQTIKKAGISVGIILLAGVGGAKFAPQHVKNSLQFLLKMPLTAEDIVYLSPLFAADDSEYAQKMQNLGIIKLTEEEMLQQIAEFKTRLKAFGQSRPRVTLYDIREFLY